MAIVGPSGCGKSTLLRLAAGLTPPTTGRITVGARNVGYVFQDPTLLPWRTVRRNVELLGELHGVPKPERQGDGTGRHRDGRPDRVRGQVPPRRCPAA